MNKIILIITILLSGMIAINSAARNKQVKTEYIFPDAMAPAVRTEFTKLCEKGRILYEINCAGCHNTLTGKKDIIPDFTEEQLGAYSIRVANPGHEEQVSEAHVSAEELALITTFLTYKKKNDPLILIHNGLPHS